MSHCDQQAMFSSWLSAAQVALALLQHCEQQLLPMTDMEDIVHFLKAEVNSHAINANVA